MQNIQETIDYVCKVLRVFGVVGLTANHFRQAKHDHPEAIIPMTTLLKHVCMLDLFDFSCQLAFNDIDMDILISLLVLRGCPLIVNQTLKMNSSRDILQIVGQILAEQELFEKYRLIFVSKLYSHQVQTNETPTKLEFTPLIYDTRSQDPTLEYIKLNQLLQQRQKYYLQLLKRKESAEVKLNQIIKSLNIGNFTVKQLWSLSNQEGNQLQIGIQTLTEENEQIKHQEIFWAWLESVVDEDKKSCRDNPIYGFQDTYQRSEDVRNLQKSIDNKINLLNKAKEEFKNLASQFDQEWERVAQILQVDGQEKLQQLQSQIPKILSQQNKQYIPLDKFLESSQKPYQSNHYDQNELIKREISSIHTVIPQNQTHKTDDDLKQDNTDLEGDIQQQKQSLIEDLQQIITQTKDIFQIYPSFV